MIQSSMKKLILKILLISQLLLPNCILADEQPQNDVANLAKFITDNEELNFVVVFTKQSTKTVGDQTFTISVDENGSVSRGNELVYDDENKFTISSTPDFIPIDLLSNGNLLSIKVTLNGSDKSEILSFDDPDNSSVQSQIAKQTIQHDGEEYTINGTLLPTAQKEINGILLPTRELIIAITKVEETNENPNSGSNLQFGTPQEEKERLKNEQDAKELAEKQKKKELLQQPTGSNNNTSSIILQLTNHTDNQNISFVGDAYNPNDERPINFTTAQNYFQKYFSNTTSQEIPLPNNNTPINVPVSLNGKTIGNISINPNATSSTVTSFNTTAGTTYVYTSKPQKLKNTNTPNDSSLIIKAVFSYNPIDQTEEDLQQEKNQTEQPFRYTNLTQNKEEEKKFNEIVQQAEATDQPISIFKNDTIFEINGEPIKMTFIPSDTNQASILSPNAVVIAGNAKDLNIPLIIENLKTGEIRYGYFNSKEQQIIFPINANTQQVISLNETTSQKTLSLPHPDDKAEKTILVEEIKLTPDPNSVKKISATPEEIARLYGITPEDQQRIKEEAIENALKSAFDPSNQNAGFIYLERNDLPLEINGQKFTIHFETDHNREYTLNSTTPHTKFKFQEPSVNNFLGIIDQSTKAFGFQIKINSATEGLLKTVTLTPNDFGTKQITFSDKSGNNYAFSFEQLKNPTIKGENIIFTKESTTKDIPVLVEKRALDINIDLNKLSSTPAKPINTPSTQVPSTINTPSTPPPAPTPSPEEIRRQKIKQEMHRYL